MVFVGAGLGQVGIVPDGLEYFLGPNVAKIALEDGLNNSFVCNFLSSTLGFGNVTGMSKATAQGSISMGNIREVFVPLAPMLEQAAIIDELESNLSEIDNLDKTITTALQQSEALRQSILKKAFSGQLVPQDPHDEPAAVLLARIKAERESVGAIPTGRPNSRTAKPGRAGGVAPTKNSIHTRRTKATP